MEFFLEIFPRLIWCFSDYRKEIGNKKFFFSCFFIPFAIFLIVALFTGEFYWKFFIFYIILIAIFIVIEILITDYGHVHLFGKRKEEQKEEK